MDGFDLAATRKRAGLLQAEVAKKAGIVVHVLTAIERNEVIPSEEVQAKILSSIDELAAEKTAAA
jgi:DNA-binding XRE family transcriptional regulator